MGTRVIGASEKEERVWVSVEKGETEDGQR